MATKTSEAPATGKYQPATPVKAGSISVCSAPESEPARTVLTGRVVGVLSVQVTTTPPRKPSPSSK